MKNLLGFLFLVNRVAVFFLIPVLLSCSPVKAQQANQATVYIFLSETCPICQSSTLALRKLYQEFSDKGIRFIGVFPNRGMSSAGSLEKFKKKYHIPFELKTDSVQLLVSRFCATITPQVFIVQETPARVLYKGKIDNNFERVGKKREVVTANYVQDALVEILAGKQVSLAETEAVGCFIIR
jgi:peroxiredoxin